MKVILAALVGVVLGLGTSVVLPNDEARSELPGMVTVAPVDAEPKWLDVARADDAGKPGAGRSVMGQLTMRQAARTSGPSPDSLRFRFDAPVEITGVVISVDISGPALVEVVAGVNVEHPYGVTEPARDGHQTFDGRDWLLHTSDSNTGPSKIDEAITLPVPVALDAGDWVAVDAWLGNHQTTATGISPEVIVFYRWL